MTVLVADGARSPIRCVVKGCAEPVDPGVLICRIHAQALRPAPPVKFSHPPKIENARATNEETK